MIDALENALLQVVESGETSRVSTTTLLPSGAMASVVVRPTGNGTFLVSDDGAGRTDMLTLGHAGLTGSDRRRGDSIANRLGLIFDGTGFAVREVTADQLAGAIVFVAEATRDWASVAVDNAVKRSRIDMSKRVEDRIRAIAPNARITRESEVTGASAKRHKFDLVMELGQDRKAVFEFVSPNSNSLSAAHLKLFDVRNAHGDWPREVITERLENWSAADMSLLNGVATHVRAMDRDWHGLAELVH